MKNKLLWLAVGLAILSVLLGINFSTGQKSEEVVTEEYIGRQELRVSRAEIAKMVALLNYSEEELSALERVITYTDTDEEKWYDKYINGMYVAGLTEEEAEVDNQYHPVSYLTVAECDDLIRRIVIQKESKEEAAALLAALDEIVTEEGKEAYLSRKNWILLYEILWQDIFKADLEETSLYIAASWQSDKTLEKWQAATDRGVFYGTGLDFLQFEDEKIRAYVRDSQLVCILDTENEDTLLSNVWIMEQEETSLTVFLNGCTKTFSLSGDLEEEISQKVADLTVKEGVISKVSVKPDAINGRVLLSTTDYIELEGYGKKSLSADFKIYCTYGDEISMETARSILVGYKNTDFVIVGDELCAAIIKEPIQAENIRVVLKTNGFKSYYHATVSITSEDGFVVKAGDTEKTYKAGKTLKLTVDSELLEEERVQITSKKEDGKLTVTSIKRNGENPSYRGTLEVVAEKDGLLLVNELPLEEYLYAVIPSEMPTTYGVEAQKVQAICARSYAYRQLLSNGCAAYGAHVDDSSLYQVYNNIPENDTSMEAVKETKGQILTYEGELITAYYFSTSCGYTANANEVWNSQTQVPYLVGSLQSKDKEKEWDLTKEENFKEFISKDPVDTFDSESAWYRWQTTISLTDLKKTIDANLENRYRANSSLVLTKQEDGSFKSVPISTVGTVKTLSVEKRGTGGIVTELIITGSENTVKILTEYNIRLLLAPTYDTVTRQDNSQVESLSLLPSAFFYLEKETTDGTLTGYSFVGGGYGHGVGMSQNGAKAMLDEGYTCEEVLEHYYKGVTIGEASLETLR